MTEPYDEIPIANGGMSDAMRSWKLVSKSSIPAPILTSSGSGTTSSGGISVSGGPVYSGGSIWWDGTAMGVDTASDTKVDATKLPEYKAVKAELDEMTQQADNYAGQIDAERAENRALERAVKKANIELANLERRIQQAESAGHINTQAATELYEMIDRARELE